MQSQRSLRTAVGDERGICVVVVEQFDVVRRRQMEQRGDGHEEGLRIDVGPSRGVHVQMQVDVQQIIAVLTRTLRGVASRCLRLVVADVAHGAFAHVFAIQRFGDGHSLSGRDAGMGAFRPRCVWTMWVASHG